MELNGGKRRDCMTVLLVDNPHNKFSKNIKKVAGKFNPITSQEAKTKNRWKEIIVNRTERFDFLETVSESTANRFIENLKDEGYLIEDGEKLGSNRPYTTFRIDKKAIRKDLIESESYIREYPLWRHLISKAGDF